MNKTTKQLSDKYNAFLAIIAYKADEQYYLESHTIDKNGAMLEGHPLKQETLQNLISELVASDQSDVGGVVPENVIYFQKGVTSCSMIWYRPEEKRTIQFSKWLNLPSGTVWVPPLIYVANGRSLSVFAMNKNTRPNEKTKLFLAPFHNVSNNGAVCLGSAKAKFPQKIDFLSLMHYWETMFWMSEFSHLTGGNHTKTNMNLVWKRLVENPDLKWSKLDELLPSTMSYKKLINKYESPLPLY